jgi:hypothetical protein
MNVAKRLSIYLPAAPEEFQTAPITRAQLNELEKNPPEWLKTLKANGPHPRQVVAGRLGISISGLARGGLTEALTTTQIDELRQNPPAWLIEERERVQKHRELESQSNATNQE